jgi:hypothetical protein
MIWNNYKQQNKFIMLVTLDIPENKVPFMMELFNNLDFLPNKKVKIEVMNDDSFERGIFETHQKPSDFAGIWKGEKRDLKQLRAIAWKQR